VTLLDATQLTFAYRPGGPRVLDGVSVALAAGEVVALFGPNGSGKSTLMQVVLGHHRPSSGGVRWLSRDVGRWRPRALARTVAYLPQAPTHEPGQTVADVLRMGRMPYWGAFGLESAADAEVVTRVATELELTDVLHRRLDELSGGQRQRAFVGRCLVQEPSAVLLDEPSTFLDLRHQVDLFVLLRRLARERGIGVLLASHDLNLSAAYADRAILLHHGRVAAAGSPDAVLDPDVLRTVYEVSMIRLNVPGCTVPVVVPRPA
jgi:iron complex transport system ATP-binding protein